MSLAQDTKLRPTAGERKARKLEFTVQFECGHVGNGLAFTVEAQAVAKASALKVKCPSCRPQRKRFKGPEMTPEVTPNWEHTSEQLAAEARRLYAGTVCSATVHHSCGCPGTAWWNSEATKEMEIKTITSRPCPGCWPVVKAADVELSGDFVGGEWVDGIGVPVDELRRVS